MRRLALPLIALVVLSAPVAAHASTVLVRSDPDSKMFEGPDPGPNDFYVMYDEVYYVAAPGEANRVVVTFQAGGQSVTVSDPGATIAPQDSCVAIDAHTVRCDLPPGSPAINDELYEARAELGDGDDTLEIVSGGAPDARVRADGGAGSDRLQGGPGSNVLGGGGGGIDILIGGARGDVLSDGDAGEAGTGPDVLDGGAGSDTVTYRGRANPVTADLRGGGEDTLTSIATLIGGSADDMLTGDEAAQTIEGGPGDDTIVALGGKDLVAGGHGDDLLAAGTGDDVIDAFRGHDSLSCGDGTDLVLTPGRGVLVGRACETLRFFHSGYRGSRDSMTFPAQPAQRSAAAPVFSLRCPLYSSNDFGESTACYGRLVLREAGSGRLLGSASFDRAGRFTVVVKLNATGRRLMRRKDGVVTTAALRGDGIIDREWTLHLTATA